MLFRSAAEVFEQVFELIRAGNVHALFDMMAEDVVMEFPFAPPSRPRRVEGKNKIIMYNQAILDIVSFSHFTDVEIHRMINPDWVVVEMTSHGTVLATGKTFERRYIDVCRTKNGRIKLIRDYWNPQESPKLNLVTKLKVAYRIIGGTLKGLRHPRKTE